MRKVLAYMFYAAGVIPTIFLIGCAFYFSFDLVSSVFPEWLVYLSILFFPLLFSIAPFYDLFANGNWTLLLLNYGCWIPAAVGIWIGSAINPE